MSSSRANTFGTFLQTVQGANTPKSGSPSPSPQFDREAVAKLALSLLSQTGRSTFEELRERLNLSKDQTEEVVIYLQSSKLLDLSDSGGLELTSFAQDALAAFKLT